jgi:DNA-binding response OmpR family regulator
MSDSNAEGTRAPGLEGLHVLVVEDRGLIAGKIVQILTKAGCAVVGPVATLEAGLRLAHREDISIDAAVLDIDLRGELVYPLAETLRRRRLPFLFLTGFEETVMPEAWRDAPRLQKPIDPTVLSDALRALMSSGPALADDPNKFPAAAPTPGSSWQAIRRSRNLIMEGEIRIRDAEISLLRSHRRLGEQRT